jgi:GMP synthase (glutamine-hydrolysing)
MTKTALIFTHEPAEGPAIFGDVLKARGFAQDIIYAPKHNLDAVNKDADLLLVMGGPMGVYEVGKYPFITREVEFIKERIAAKRPILGICLGSQLMAAALGAKVYKGKAGQEIGWSDIKINADGQKGATRHLDGPMFHWHGDTFDLPVGATLLASSEKYANQIYSYGNNALALQCHPEVKEGELEGWYEAFNNDVNAAKVEKLRLDTKANISTLNAKTKKFFAEWLEVAGL